MWQELETGIQLAKCQQCGCMLETLTNLAALLPTVNTNETQALAQRVEKWTGQIQLIRYACLGCDHCYPAVAQNAFAAAFPWTSPAPGLSCDFKMDSEAWPPVVGEYFVPNKTAPVAVSTLASLELAEDLAKRQPDGLAMVGKTETENIGLDKVIKNVITNPALRYLIVAGSDPQGHQPGRTLLALAEHGVDANGRVIGSPGKRPILRNVSAAEIQHFREQVQIIDLIGCDSADELMARIGELAAQNPAACGCSECAPKVQPISISTAQTVIEAVSNQAVKMDRAGYFVIVPLADKGIINVEHYSYDNNLLRVVEGAEARAIYLTIIANGWVTELSHAAYLGKELAKVELSLKYGFKYVQDGA